MPVSTYPLRAPRTRLRGVSLALLAASVGWAQQQPSTSESQRLEITLERLEGGAWKAQSPDLVFNNGDRIRFRVRSNFPGYLYVINLGTSGEYTLLFPREDTGSDNRIDPGTLYTVPATESGSFRITGPPGYDVTYWQISPVSLGAAPAQPYVPLPPPPPKREGKSPYLLLPRCDDTVLRARGECVDRSAGPRQVEDPGQLPENLARQPQAGARELVFLRREKQAVVASEQPLGGPVVYEFRIAHK